MRGIFGSASRGDAVPDVFYGTDYHSHLGTRRGGMVVRGEAGVKRNTHDITNAPFRTKFEEDLPKHRGHLAMGVISDYEDQPLLIRSHHGRYGIATVGRIENLDALAARVLARPGTHFAELRGDEVNPAELVAALVYSCRFLNFSRSRSELDLAGRKAILELEGDTGTAVEEYAEPCPARSTCRPAS